MPPSKLNRYLMAPSKLNSSRRQHKKQQQTERYIPLSNLKPKQYTTDNIRSRW